MRRWFFMVLLLTLLCVCLSITAAGAETHDQEYQEIWDDDFHRMVIWASGRCGDNITWEWSRETGQTVISGSGDMWDFNNYNDEYSSIWCGTTVVIESGITSIGDYAFDNKVYGDVVFLLPQTLNRIGRNAFRDAVLSEIDIPDGVTEIGEGAFADCDFLESVTLPRGLSEISSYTFRSCDKLKRVTIKSDITRIGDSAFASCEQLEELVIPESVTFIGDDAFYGCSTLTNINIPKNLTAISKYTFSNMKALTEITIPERVTEIGDGAFSYCSSLSRVNMPANVKVIGESAFSNCSVLAGISLPEGLLEMGRYAFEDCTALSEISIPGSLELIGYEAFLNCSGLKKLTIGYGVAEIDSGAFKNCTSLQSVSFPASVYGLGEYVFGGCTGLKSVSFPLKIESWTKTIHLADGVFDNCTNLSVLSLPCCVGFYFRVNSICPETTVIYCMEGSEADVFAREAGYSVIYCQQEDTRLEDWNEDIHTYLCHSCGKETNYNHVYCDGEPDTCAVCGHTTAEGVAYLRHHQYDSNVYQCDSETHWKECELCGEIIDRYRHWAECTDTDICGQCSMTVAEGAVMDYLWHDCEWAEYKDGYDSEYCWYICKACGAEVEKFLHAASCTNPDQCAFCGHTTADGIVFDGTVHNISYYIDDLQFDALSHWYICQDCGQKCEEEKHQALCESPETCLYCKHTTSEGIVVNELYHNGIYMVAPEYDSKQHWSVCPTCGERVIVFDHYDDNGDGECDWCGAEIVQTEKPGDLSGDGKINLKDSMLLLQYLAGWEIEFDEKNADINGDGKVNLKDSMLLLQYLAGWESEYIK